MPGKLPGLNRREAADFLTFFAPGHVQKPNNKVAGVNRQGKPFLIELEHSLGMRPDILQAALRYLDVSRDEFWAWHARRKRR